MSWAIQQAWAKKEVGASQTSSGVLFLTSTPTTGNLLAAFLEWYDGASTTAGTVTIKDANNVAFTIPATAPSNSKATSAGIVYGAYLQVPATPNGSITATFNTTGAGGLATLWVAEYTPSGGSFGGIDDAVAGTDAAAQIAINTPTLAVNQANDLCVACGLSSHQVSSVDTPWTQRAAGIANQFSEGIGDILSRGTNVTVAMTQNVSADWDSYAMSFKFTAATAPVGHYVGINQNTFGLQIQNAGRAGSPW